MNDATDSPPPLKPASRYRRYSVTMIFGILFGAFLSAVLPVVIAGRWDQLRQVVHPFILPLIIVAPLPMVLAKNGAEKGYPPVRFMPVLFLAIAAATAFIILVSDLL